MIRVSFQGERGAYSEGAALVFFDNNEKIETIPLPSFAEVLNSTISKDTDYSILPVENSIEGSVGESYDLLYSTPLMVIGEVYHKIEHCLIGSGDMTDVDTVYSHPQALGQCRRFLQENNIRTVPTYDTAGSVKIVKDMGKKNVACIASKNASQIYAVPIIKSGIADNPNNFTRFLVLRVNNGKGDGMKCDGNNSKCKTSIIFSIKHEQGALYRVMEKMQRYGINMTKIESRPKKDTPWEYNFFVDFEGNQIDEKVSKMLSEIKQDTLFMKILGTYPLARYC
jgi:prephenate dehydratase